VERLRDEIVGDTDRALWLLFGATGLVLLIACANVANLLLSRSEARAREIAVRAAFGAGRGRLVRQLLTESLLLSGLGSVAGVALAWAGVRALLTLMPVALPRQDAIGMNGPVLLGVVAAGILTGVLFGMAPILRLLASDVRTAMHDGARTTASAGNHRTQGLFVAGQFALALVVVVGAGLLVRSFANLRAVDPGFRAQGVLTTELDLPVSVAPDDTAVIEFYDQLRSRIARLPGVVSVGDASSLPLGTDHDYVQPFRMDVQELPPDVETRAAFRPVSPGFFETLRTPVLEGRGLEPSDRLDVAGVAVVNEAFVRRFLSDGSPLGARLVDIGYRFGPLGAIDVEGGDAEIVGVVKNVKYDGLRTESQPAIYLSGLQSSIRRRTLVIRTEDDPRGLLPAVRREVGALSGQVALTHTRTLQDVVGDARARDRFSTLLLSLFAAVALVLASVGVYGVLSYAVAQRRTEMGIRMALGADRSKVRRMVLRDGLKLVGSGLLVGLAGAVALSDVVASQLYGVSPRDPGVLGAVAVVLLLVGLLASLLPALRATRVDPMAAMRAE
jgi:putative ABC transport system permease protein